MKLITQLCERILLLENIQTGRSLKSLLVLLNEHLAIGFWQRETLQVLSREGEPLGLARTDKESFKRIAIVTSSSENDEIC